MCWNEIIIALKSLKNTLFEDMRPSFLFLKFFEKESMDSW